MKIAKSDIFAKKLNIQIHNSAKGWDVNMENWVVKMRTDDRDFSRKLRKELLAEQKVSIYAVIARLSADGGDANE